MIKIKRIVIAEIMLKYNNNTNVDMNPDTRADFGGVVL